MPEPKRPLKVFLCHAHTDHKPVHELYARLTQDGVDAWLDKEKLLPGQDWELEIKKAVREADVVVVCQSKQFKKAGFRQKEVRLALDIAMEKPEDEIFMIPARLEECDTLESLQKWHWVNLFDENGYETLLRSLRLQAMNKQIEIQIHENRISTDKNNKAVEKKADISVETEDEKLKAEATKLSPQWLDHKRIVTFYSRSEESGKIDIIVNLATEAALAGLRIGVVDMDFRSSGIHAQFGLKDNVMGKSMIDFLYGDATIREVGVPVRENVVDDDDGYYSKLKDVNIWLFPFSVKMKGMYKILIKGLNLEKVDRCLKTALVEFDLDCIFVNNAFLSGADEENLKAVTFATIINSDVFIPISRLNQRDYQDVAVAVDVANKVGVADISIIVNKLLSSFDLHDVIYNFEKSFGVRVLGALPLSARIESGVDSGIFSLRYPEDDWSISLRQIAQNIFGDKPSVSKTVRQLPRII